MADRGHQPSAMNHQPFPFLPDRTDSQGTHPTMNRETRKTLAFVAVAVALMGAAAIVDRVDRSSRPEAFNDQGRKFFDDFDPAACTTLEVFEYDPSTLSPLPFKATLKDGKWVIPSHYDYPADAKQRLVETATGVIGL